MWRALLISVLLLALSAPADAKQHRSATAIAHFKKAHPCPANGAIKGPCPGFTIDHIIALKCGGPDRPDNMQYMTTADAKAKDRWELKECRK